MNEARRPACIILAAAPGDFRAARSLVSRAIRSTLAVRKHETAPYFVHFTSGDSLRANGLDRDAGQYTLEVSDEEFSKLMSAIGALASNEGWSRPPTDSYHD